MPWIEPLLCEMRPELVDHCGAVVWHRNDKSQGSMPGNNAQQVRRDPAYFLAPAESDQCSFTLCFPADY
jgi:hypothetical protein